MAKVKVYRPSIDEVKGGVEWSALEAGLLGAARSGRVACLSGKEGVPPDCTDLDRRVRAGLIRYLLLGGCDSEGGARPHPKGVQFAGGWIDGVLDLESCHSPLDLSLDECLLPERANLQDARLGALYLAGCAAPKGLHMDRLTTRSDVQLSAGFTSGVTVDLGGARIGGQLGCEGGMFEATEGWSLNCDAAQIAAHVFLTNGFHATAQVDFRGAEIGGHLVCEGGTFAAVQGKALNCDSARIGESVFLRDGFRATAEVSFVCAEIGGQLACDGGRFEAAEGQALNGDAAQIGADVFLRDGFRAVGLVYFARATVAGAVVIRGASIENGINLEAARVGDGLFWKSVTGARRVVDLTEARVGSLRDDRESWEGVGTLILDGFRYDRLEGSMSVSDRIVWLENAEAGLLERHDLRSGPAFDPQPHVHLANVLRAQGDRSGAARVLVHRERRQRRAQRYWTWMQTGSPMGMTRWLFAVLLRPFDALFGLLFGYGHRPARALIASIVLVGIASTLAGAAYKAGQFAPNSDVILTSTAWHDALAAVGTGGLPLPHWLAQAPEARDYEAFHPVLYGLDLFIPLEALGQEAAWRPATGRGWLGEVAFYSRWFFQSAGWIITALAAAVLTGLVGRRD